MPATQLPLAHALLPLHESPLVFLLTQAEPAQYSVLLEQSLSSVHEVLQVVAPQT